MNLPKNKHVHIFDFDETLCKTNAEISVYDNEEDVTFFLHPTNYPAWREQQWVERFPGRFDMNFSEFQGYPTKGTPISGTVTMLKVLLTSEEDLCVLVTGRDELSGPRAWLLGQNIDADKMIIMCSGNPDKKPAYESVINTLQPAKITIYEDTDIYIEQCQTVCEKYNIPFDFRQIRA